MLLIFFFGNLSILCCFGDPFDAAGLTFSLHSASLIKPLTIPFFLPLPLPLHRALHLPLSHSLADHSSPFADRSWLLADRSSAFKPFAGLAKPSRVLPCACLVPALLSPCLSLSPARSEATLIKRRRNRQKNVLLRKWM